MIGFLSILWCLALVILLCSEAKVSRLLCTRLAEEPLARFMARQRARFVRLIVAAIIVVAVGELLAMPGSAELAASAAPYIGALVATTVAVAVSCSKGALQAYRADLSYWQIRALDVSGGTFGKCARRKRGNAPSADNDDAATEFVAAA